MSRGNEIDRLMRDRYARGQELPRDPDLDNKVLQDGKYGLHVLAVMLATFKRELLAEGFDSDEAYALTEAWMAEAMSEAQNT